MNKKNLIIGIFFIVIAIICLLSLLGGRTNSYYITGCIVSVIIGIAFIKRSRY